MSNVEINFNPAIGLKLYIDCKLIVNILEEYSKKSVKMVLGNRYGFCKVIGPVFKKPVPWTKNQEPRTQQHSISGRVVF